MSEIECLSAPTDSDVLFCTFVNNDTITKQNKTVLLDSQLLK